MWTYICDKMLKNPQSRVFDKNTSLSYLELINLSKVHGEFIRSKVTEGAKCVIFCKKELNTAIAILTCWYAKVVPILVSSQYGKNHALAIIKLMCPDFIISDFLERYEYERAVYRIDNQTFEGAIYQYKIEEELSDVAVVMCTSGTTGTPKGTMITYAGLKTNIESIGKYFGVNNWDTIMIVRPLYHCSALTGEFLLGLYRGADIYFFDGGYDPFRIIAAIKEQMVTVMCGTPTLFNHISKLLLFKNDELSIKAAISGECLTNTVAKNIRKAFPKSTLYNVYGLTEAAPRVSYLPASEFDKYPESVGFPLDKTTIKIVEINNYSKEMPTGISGMVLVKSPSIMKGYYKEKQLSALALQNGWLVTGDIGYVDEGGRLYIRSRADEMIIKGGMNIYPKEIEQIVLKLDEINECLVYGISSELGQEIGMDVVVEDSGKSCSKMELLKKITEILPSYQVPSQLNIVSQIPRNASGKIIRMKK